MALVDKYYLDFYSQDTKQYRIQIQQEGWGGSNTDVSVADDGAPVPINVSWKGDDDIFSVMHGSNATVGLYSVTDLKWKEFFDVGWGSYACVLKELGTVDTARSAQFTAANTEFLSSSSADFTPPSNSAFSFGGWFRFDSVSTNQGLFSVWDFTSDRSYVVFLRGSSNNIRMIMSDDGTTSTTTLDHSTTIAADQWYFISVVHNAGANTIGISLDGAALQTASHSTGPYTGTNSDFEIGSFNTITGPSVVFNGRADQCFYYAKTLSASNITTLYNAGVGQCYEDADKVSLTSWWRMNEASGARTDVHGSNNLTDNNTVTSGTNKVIECSISTDIWTGYVESGMYGEPWQGVPYPVSLNFNCGLGRLKNITFTADGLRGGTKHTGSKSLLECIRLCLNQLPTPLSIREVYNIYEETQTTATSDSPLTQVYIKPEFYNEKDTDQEPPIESAKSCWDVLHGILGSLGARIFQWENYWYIVRHEEIDATTLTYREFLPRVGSESTLTVDASGTISHDHTIDNDTSNRDNRIFPFQGSGDLSVKSALEKIKINYKPTPDDTIDSDFVKNPCLGDWSTPSGGDGMPLYWTAGSGITDPDTYSSRLGLGTYGYPPCEYAFGFKKSDLDAATSFDSDAYIEMTNTAVPTASADLFTFSFGYMRDINIVAGSPSISNAYSLAHSMGRVQLRFMIQIGTKYWVGNNLDSSMTDPSGALITPASPVWSTTLGYYDVYLNAYPTPDEFAGQLENHTVQLSAIGLDGTQTLTVRVYLPVNNVVDTDAAVDPATAGSLSWADAGMFFTGIHCWYLPSGAPQAEEVILSSILDADADVYEIDVKHGDGPSAGSLASFRLSDDSITQTWSRRGQGDAITITKQLANMITRMRGEHRINVSGGLTGDIDYYDRLSTTVSTSGGDVTYSFLIQSLEWDVQNYEYNINMIELDTTNSIPAFEDITVGPFHPPPSNSPVSDEGPPILRMGDDIVGDSGVVSSSGSSSDYPTA